MPLFACRPEGVDGRIRAPKEFPSASMAAPRICDMGEHSGATPRPPNQVTLTIELEKHTGP
jgi:hypothetical protein